MTSSVRSRWQHVPARMLAVCVAEGQLSWVEALAVVEQIPGESARARAMEELCPVLPEQGLALLLEQVLTTGYDGVLRTLVPFLPLELVRRAIPTARRKVFRFDDDAAIHELIFRLADVGEFDEALDLFAEYPSVPLALRLGPALDGPRRARLVADPGFLVRVVSAGGGAFLAPALLGAWAEQVLSGPVDPDTAKALVAAYPRLPAHVRDRIDPGLLCAAAGDREQAVIAAADLAPALNTAGRRAVLEQAVALAMSAPVSAPDPTFPELRAEPERGKLCRIMATVVAQHGDRQLALDLAKVAFEAALTQTVFTTYGGHWLGSVFIDIADGDVLDEAIRRVAAPREPWLRVHQILAVLPSVTEQHAAVLVPAIRAAISQLNREQRADILIATLPWLPPEERESALDTALRSDRRLPLRAARPPGTGAGQERLMLPDLAGLLPAQARLRLADRVVAAAAGMDPADVATTLLAAARMSEPDRRPALLLDAIRAHRDSLTGPQQGSSGGWLPLTDDEVRELDLREMLDVYQVIADGEQIRAYEHDLLRDLGDLGDDGGELAAGQPRNAALAEYYARAGDLTTATLYGQPSAWMVLYASAVLSGRELLDFTARLPDDQRVQALAHLAADGPLDVLGEVVETARSLVDLDARGKILVWAAERTPDAAEAVRLGREAWQLAVDTGVVGAKEVTGTTVLWAHGRWLGSAAVDAMLPLLPARKRDR